MAGRGRARRQLPGPSRNIPPEVISLFEKYTENNVRNLKKPEAIFMLESEFHLDKFSATGLFDTFDKDKNGVLSIWEFQQFFETIGNDAHDIVEKFKELDKDGSGKLDPEEARAGLKELKTGSGRVLEDKEIDFFIKTTAGDDGLIDVGHFTNMVYRLKLYDCEPPSHQHKH